jgi:hypothetical protein
LIGRMHRHLCMYNVKQGEVPALSRGLLQLKGQLKLQGIHHEGVHWAAAVKLDGVKVEGILPDEIVQLNRASVAWGAGASQGTASPRRREDTESPRSQTPAARSSQNRAEMRKGMSSKNK